MTTTVRYKGSTITTVDNQTRTLTTSGKYLEDNITLTDVSGGGSANIVALNVTNNGSYSASGDVDGYSPVTVNISGGGDFTLATVEIINNSPSNDAYFDLPYVYYDEYVDQYFITTSSMIRHSWRNTLSVILYRGRITSWADGTTFNISTTGGVTYDSGIEELAVTGSGTITLTDA